MEHLEMAMKLLLPHVARWKMFVLAVDYVNMAARFLELLVTVTCASKLGSFGVFNE